MEDLPPLADGQLAGGLVELLEPVLRCSTERGDADYPTCSRGSPVNRTPFYAADCSLQSCSCSLTWTYTFGDPVGPGAGVRAAPARIKAVQ